MCSDLVPSFLVKGPVFWFPVFPQGRAAFQKENLCFSSGILKSKNYFWVTECSRQDLVEGLNVEIS